MLFLGLDAPPRLPCDVDAKGAPTRPAKQRRSKRKRGDVAVSWSHRRCIELDGRLMPSSARKRFICKLLCFRKILESPLLVDDGIDAGPERNQDLFFCFSLVEFDGLDHGPPMLV